MPRRSVRSWPRKENSGPWFCSKSGNRKLGLWGWVVQCFRRALGRWVPFCLDSKRNSRSCLHSPQPATPLPLLYRDRPVSGSEWGASVSSKELDLRTKPQSSSRNIWPSASRTPNPCLCWWISRRLPGGPIFGRRRSRPGLSVWWCVLVKTPPRNPSSCTSQTNSGTFSPFFLFVWRCCCTSSSSQSLNRPFSSIVSTRDGGCSCA